MVQPDIVETKQKKPNNSKLGVIALIVIIAIIVTWIAIYDRNRADVDVSPEPVVLKDRTGNRQFL